MRFRKLSRKADRWTWAVVPVLASALGLAGCAADYVTGSQATVLLLVTSINDGTPVLSDVRGGDSGGTILNCQVLIKVKNITKDPNSGGSNVEGVTLDRYDVSFHRADGRGAEGVDVPFSFSSAMTRTVAVGAEETISIDLVRHQAKLEPPLSNIAGLQVVSMSAEVTVVGRTVSGASVTASGSAEVRFADYASGTTTCESGT
jgi:hypothetical protein